MPARLTNNKLYKIFSIFDDATFTRRKIRLFLIRSKNRSQKRKSSRRGAPLLPKYSLYPFILSEKKKKKKLDAANFGRERRFSRKTESRKTI